MKIKLGQLKIEKKLNEFLFKKIKIKIRIIPQISFALYLPAGRQVDKSFSFSLSATALATAEPKKPFQILAERRVSHRELTSPNLHFPNWRKR